MSELKSLFATAFPAEASPSAPAKLVDAALRADRSAATSRRRVRWSYGFGAATAVVAGVLLFPSLSTAAYLGHIGQLMADARSAHIVEWSIRPDGVRKVTREMWFQDGRWRVDAPMFGTQTLSDGQKKWTYDLDQKRVVVTPEDGSFMGGGRFTLSSILADPRNRGNVHIVKVGREKQVSLDNPIDHSTVVFWVNAETDYPERGEVRAHTPKGDQVTMAFGCEFNEPLNLALFRPQFPREAKVVDESAGEAYWQRKLSASSIAASTKAVGTLRDVQVTQRGDVFLLLSGPADGQTFEVTDDLGNQYAVCEGLQAATYSYNQETHDLKFERGLSVHGQPVTAKWFTPLHPVSGKWSARTLAIRATTVSYRADPEMIKRLPRGSMVKMTDMTRVATPAGEWHVRMQAPTCDVTPDYMPFMGMRLSTEFDVARQAADARATYFLDKGMYAEAEPQLRDLISRVEDHERTTGQRWVKSSYFYRLYVSLKNQGKTQEARQWLSRVQSEPGGPDEKMSAALRAEGM